MAIERTISLDVNYSKKFMPDIIDYRISISGQAKDVEDANNEMAQRLENVKQMLISAGIPANNISTPYANVSTEKATVYTTTPPDDTEYIRSYQKIIADGKEVPLYEAGTKTKGYSYYCTIEAKDRIADKHEETIWDAMMKCSEEYGDGFQFEVSYSLAYPDSCQNNLKIEALKHGRQEAYDLAQAARATLGHIVMIDYSTRSSSRDMDAFADFSIGASKRASAASTYQMPKFDPKPIEISCYVHLTYELLVD